MTRIIFSLILLGCTVLYGTLPAAANGDIRTCSVNKVLECLPDEGCEETTVQEMNLPRFVKIDLNAKTMTSLDKEVPRTSDITSIEQLEGETILHGTEQRGWTMTLSDDGDLTLAASGDGEGFIVFGSCIKP